MGLIIGMDEAGYGPNLGPLVITATVWEVGDTPRDVDFWTAFADAVTNAPKAGETRLHLADSKEVYSPARGLRSLERTVLSAFGLLDFAPRTFDAVLKGLCETECAESVRTRPWCRDAEQPIPSGDSTDSLEMTARWTACCRETGIHLRGIHSDVVTAERFNRLIDEHGNKAQALSRTAMQLLRRVWNPNDDQPALIIGDKHGGRNRYDDLLDDIVDGIMIFRQQESRRLSSYRVGNSELRFQMKAESHLPVALASMVCKYVRELSMELFNRFWQSHVPGLKPTKGYPVDARRFKDDIADAQARLEISDAELWRCR